MNTLTIASLAAVFIGVLLPLYCFVVYPLVLNIAPRRYRKAIKPEEIEQWPSVTVVIPVYNGKDTIFAKLTQILDLDYPKDKLHILVVSDASDDGTNEIARSFEDRGVEVVVLEERGGKTAAENAARDYLRGDVVFSTDAAVSVDGQALKHLVAPFADPEVGVTTGRIFSVKGDGGHGLDAESWYNGYDMRLRQLETELYGVVGAAGAIFASRRELHEDMVPSALSRDFAAPLIAREKGFRSLLIPEATCAVARGMGLGPEYRRKVRTMTRGLETLYFKRHLANPAKYGVFAWMLWSHKVARWLIPVGCGVATIGVGLLAPTSKIAAVLFVAAIFCIGGAFVAFRWPGGRPPRALSIIAFGVGGIMAGLQAWIAALRGELNPVWEPTKRGSLGGGPTSQA